MASAIPVHSSKKGKPTNESSSPEVSPESSGPVQPSESKADSSVPQGVKLESHAAYRVDY